LAMQMPCRLFYSAWHLFWRSNCLIFIGRLARPKRFELLTPRFVVWCSFVEASLRDVAFHLRRPHPGLMGHGREAGASVTRGTPAPEHVDGIGIPASEKPAHERTSAILIRSHATFLGPIVNRTPIAPMKTDGRVSVAKGAK